MAAGNLKDSVNKVRLLHNNTVLRVTVIPDGGGYIETYDYDLYNACVEVSALRNLADMMDDNIKKMKKQTNE